MASRICPDVLNDCNPCAGEFPFANLSAELGEPYVFVSPHIIIRNPPLGRVFSQFGCKRWCYSTISQADADACAIAQATECATVTTGDPPIVLDPPEPPVGFPSVSVFASEAATSFGQDPGVFLLTRNGSFSQPLTVQFTLSGEAQNGVDYDTVPYFVTIDAGDSDVEVIIVPMDTGEIISKSVILTVLGGSNYSPGASASDTIEIAPANCGTPAFRVFGYDEAMAAEIAALFPDALASELPEWDGILREDQALAVYRSNSACFSINGKAIDLAIRPSLTLADTIGCPAGWVSADPPNTGCSFCPGLNSSDLFVSDLLTINDATESLVYVSHTTGVIGNYESYVSPSCQTVYAGSNTYRVSGDDLAHYIYGGSTFLSVVAL